MKKGARLNRAEEIVHKFSRNRDFIADVHKVRRTLSVPPEGFHDETHKNQIWSPKNRPTLVDLMEHAVSLCKKYKISPSYNFTVRQFILFDTRAASDHPADYFVLEVDDGGKGVRNKEKAYRNFGVPFIKLFVLDASSKERVIEVVRKNWPHIQDAMRTQGGDISRMRTSENKHRNYLIAKLNSHSKKELATTIGLSLADPAYKRPKPDLIADVLKFEYGYDIEPETVRKYLANPIRNLSTDKSQVNRIRRKKRK